MLGVVRIVISWLLAAALPLQGLAATSMTLCRTLGEGVPAHRHVHDGKGGPASTMNAMPGHDSAHGHRGHHQEAGQGEAAAKCSVCAACCASMAIAVAGFSLPLIALSESFASPIGAGAFPFVTDGLERPPRTSSFA